MGMSTHVVGIKPADEKFEKMLKIYKDCEEAGVSIPKEVLDFFDYDTPDESGVFVSIAEAIVSWNNGVNASGYEVFIDSLPPDVKIIRFYNSH